MANLPSSTCNLLKALFVSVLRLLEHLSSHGEINDSCIMSPLSLYLKKSQRHFNMKYFHLLFFNLSSLKLLVIVYEYWVFCCYLYNS